MTLVSAVSFGLKYTAKRISSAAGYFASVICLCSGYTAIKNTGNLAGAGLFVIATAFIGIAVFSSIIAEKRANFIDNKPEKLKEAFYSRTGNESCGCAFLALIFIGIFIVFAYTFLKSFNICPIFFLSVPCGCSRFFPIL